MKTERSIDPLGRIVIPKQMRTKLNIEVGTPLSITVSEESIVISKAGHYCKVCGSRQDNFDNDMEICPTCIQKIKTF